MRRRFLTKETRLTRMETLLREEILEGKNTGLVTMKSLKENVDAEISLMGNIQTAV